MTNVTQGVAVIRRRLVITVSTLLALICAGAVIYAVYAIGRVADYSKISASPYESEPAEIALAFAYNLNRGDDDGAAAFYDTLADSSAPVDTAKDLEKAIGLPQDCQLASNTLEDLTTTQMEKIYAVDLPYRCDGETLSHRVYLSNGEWDTPNGKGKFIISEAAAAAGQPIP